MDERFEAQEARTLHGYIAAVSSGAPAPGGGSVAAIVGALGAALGSMVATMSIARKKRPEDIPTELTEAVALLGDATRRLTDLSTQDERAYQQYIAATRLPKDTDAERSVRKATQQDALLVAADVPLAVAEIARTVLLVLTPIVRLGTRHALADCSVGAWLVTAAAHSALINVRLNAAMMDDEKRSHAYRHRADEIEAELEALKEEVLAAVAERNSPAS